jgi:hypothetical protein
MILFHPILLLSLLLRSVYPFITCSGTAGTASATDNDGDDRSRDHPPKQDT